MATYYVRPDGSNSNAGTGQASNQAWQTVTYALTNMVLTSGVNYLYIAPGIYRESPSVNVTPSSTQTLVVQGDPIGTIFSGANAGEVKITNYTSDSSVPTYATAFTCAKQYVTLRNIHFEIFGNVSFTNSNYCSVIQCIFNCVVRGNSTNQGTVRVTPPSNVPSNFTADRCVFTGSQGLQLLQFDSSVNFSHNALITRCLFLSKVGIVNLNNPALSSYGGGYTVWNCTFICNETGILSWSFNTVDKVYIYNCLFYSIGDYGTGISTTTANSTVENYNRFCVQTRGLSTGVNSIVGNSGISLGYESINGLQDVSIFAPSNASQLLNAGLVSGAPTTDINGDAWVSGVDVGAYERINLNLQSYYNPTERNQTTVTIASGSTSQSVEIYLGVTGLTATTSGLNATYNKNRTADVAIPLVARTIAQPWVAGGFAEVNPVTMPGVYRLDIPDEAISTGYGNTTIVVRGASGTNGAVVTIQEPAPVGTQLRMGPFTVQADGILTDDRLKLIQGSVHSIDFKMVDAYGTGVDGTGTVVTAKVYNAAGFLIDTYTCTAMYALDGRYSFAIDSTVTDNVGMYTINIYRQIGTETNVFGRMKLEVLSP
jgi:hypothetical protein